MTQHRRRDGMSEQMGGPATWASHSGSSEGAGHDHGDSAVRTKGTEGRSGAHEDGALVGRRPSAPQVAHQGLSHLLGERQPRLTARLAAHENARFLPVDVVQLKLNDVAGPQTQTCEQ